MVSSVTARTREDFQDMASEVSLFGNIGISMF